MHVTPLVRSICGGMISAGNIYAAAILAVSAKLLFGDSFFMALTSKMAGDMNLCT